MISKLLIEIIPPAVFVIPVLIPLYIPVNKSLFVFDQI